MENINTNYNSKYKKQIQKLKYQRAVLLILLTTSLSFNGINKFEKLNKDLDYENYSFNQYYDLVNDNMYSKVIAGKQINILNVYDLANSIKKIDFNSRNDFYQNLIGIANNIKYQKNENFTNFILALGLDSLNKENPNIPTEEEFEMFLEKNNLKNENGTINFEKWQELDKRVFELEESVGKNI